MLKFRILTKKKVKKKKYKNFFENISYFFSVKLFYQYFFSSWNCLNHMPKKSYLLFLTWKGRGGSADRFFRKCWNSHERCGIDWKKNQISDFSDLYFSSYGYFWSYLYPNFVLYPITRKINISFVSAHCASSVKTGSKLRGGGEGVLIYLVGK